MRYVLAGLALAVASPAFAGGQPYQVFWDPQCSSAGGNCAADLPSWTTATIVEDFETTPHAANGSVYVPKTVPGLYSESLHLPGNHARVQYFDTPLAGMNGQYIGIINGADYTIDLLANAGARFFSFAFNNLTTNDKVTLYYADGTSQDITGFDILNGGSIIGLKNNQIPNQPNDWGRVSYDVGSGSPITKVTFSSNGNDYWYIDSIAFAAPEPAAWALMILGFGLVGWQIRRRGATAPKAAIA